MKTKKFGDNNNMPSGVKTGQLTTKRVFTVIFVSLLIDLLAFTVILPLMPSMLDYYGHNSKVSSIIMYVSLLNELQEVLELTA